MSSTIDMMNDKCFHLKSGFKKAFDELRYHIESIEKKSSIPEDNMYHQLYVPVPVVLSVFYNGNISQPFHINARGKQKLISNTITQKLQVFTTITLGLQNYIQNILCVIIVVKWVSGTLDKVNKTKEMEDGYWANYPKEY